MVFGGFFFASLNNERDKNRRFDSVWVKNVNQIQIIIFSDNKANKKERKQQIKMITDNNDSEMNIRNESTTGYYHKKYQIT